MTNLHIKLFVCVFALLTMLIPLRASAQGTEDRAGQFCGLASERRQEIDNLLKDKISRYETANAARVQAIADNRMTADTALTEARIGADSVRNMSLTLLSQNQTSDAHRAAATTYASAVEAAVSARRTAFDTARQEFRRKVDELHAQRDRTVRDQINGLTAEVDEADDTARSECGRARADRAAIRSSFIEKLSGARLTYAQSRPDKNSAGELIKTYADERKAAFNQAVAEFERAMRAARETFAADKALTSSGN